MNYASLYNLSIVDGSGIRTSLYVSGCRRHCKGCHNSKTWNFLYGKEYTEETEKQILDALNHDYIKGFTLCGGEPMEEENQAGLINLLATVRETYPEKSIWCYTGYEWEDFMIGGKKNIDITLALLGYIDVLITGRYDETCKDITNNNLYRGSINQRIVDCQTSLKTGTRILIKGLPNNYDLTNNLIY